MVNRLHNLRVLGGDANKLNGEFLIIDLSVLCGVKSWAPAVSFASDHL